MEKYKVSILVPIYGVEKYIKRCAISLFEQSYSDIEFIFINDCTTDNSINILEKVISHYPNRVSQTKIIHHKSNMGLGGARNTAVESATGDFLFHVDSDDYIDAYCIEKCVKKQLETNADVVSVNIMKLYPNRNLILQIPNFPSPKELNLALIRHDIPNNIWGRLIRTSLYKNNGIIVEERVGMSEDLNVLPRLLYYANTVANVNEVLHYYECSNMSSYTYKFSEIKIKETEKTYNVLLSFFKDKEEVYINAIHYRFYRAFANALINSGKSGCHKAFFVRMKNKLKFFATSSQELDLPIRFALSINNYQIFCFYVRIASFLKRIFKKHSPYYE